MRDIETMCLGPGSSLYELLTALRDPDNDTPDEGEAIKNLVTARLRAIVFPRHEVPYGAKYNDDRFQLHDLPYLEANVLSFRNFAHAPHFLSHLYRAVAATLDHPIWGGLGREIHAALLLL